MYGINRFVHLETREPSPFPTEKQGWSRQLAWVDAWAWQRCKTVHLHHCQLITHLAMSCYMLLSPPAVPVEVTALAASHTRHTD